MNRFKKTTALTGMLLLTLTGTKIFAQGPPPPEPMIVTGINQVAGSNISTIHSTQNTVYVDFSKTGNDRAEVILYNVMGQQLSREECSGSMMYSKSLEGIQSGYVIVQVYSQRQVFTKKIFITN